MIYVGNLHRCGEDDPKKTGEYFVFRIDEETKEVEYIHVYGFVAGHGWNAHQASDGSVNDDCVMDLSGSRYGSVYYWMEGDIYERCD